MPLENEVWDWDKIKEAMQKGVVLITFKKVSNGELREMECTLAPYLLPETAGTGRKPEDHLVVCFDIANNGWRSFRKDSVIQVEIL